jgi:uncharacterized protein
MTPEPLTPDSVAPEAITPLAPRPAGRTVFTQDWLQLTFVHWAVDPDLVAPHLPDGVRPDTFDGATYIGLIPFQMRRIGLSGRPGVPYFGSFLETNVRVYGVDREGRRGVVFCSLEASRLATVAVTRATVGLNYVWSRMSLQRDGDRIEYRSSRRWPGPRGAATHVAARIGEPVVATPLDRFLTARWGLFLPDRAGATRYWPNEHPTWPLRSATLEHLDDGLVAAAGFPGVAAGEPVSVRFSEGVRTIFGPRRR